MIGGSPGATPTFRQRHFGDWITGLKHAAIGAFSGFLFGGLIAVIGALNPSAPSWEAAMPYIGMVGGMAFGFAEGAGTD